MIYIIHADMELWNFMLDGLKDREDVKEFPLNRYCNIFQRYFRNKYRNYILPHHLVLGKKLIKELKELKSGDKVIISAYTQRSLFNAIKRVVNDGVEINLWMWNPISSNPIFKRSVQILKNDGVKLHTFDKNDASEYDMIYHNTFYNMSMTSDSSTILYDFYFLGAAKNRKDEIRNLKEILSNYRCSFIIPTSPNEFITYKENLLNIQQTKCIVEIMQDNQYDITLRPLEALAFKKKLLTNNPHIKSYSFYDSQNIFILGEDNPTRLNEFINSPYNEIEYSILQKYDINTWVDSF